MTDKELRKLGRSALLEILIAQSKEIDRLQTQLDQASQQLADKNIAIQNAGSIAEAALQLNGIFAAAQAAADQYLQNVSQLEPVSGSAEIQTSADDILAQAQAKADQLLAETQAKCDEMIFQAKEESQRWWSETSQKMDAFYKERTGLRELLAEQLSQKAQDECL